MGGAQRAGCECEILARRCMAAATLMWSKSGARSRVMDRMARQLVTCAGLAAGS